MNIWGITKPYPALSWTRNFLGGHINIGKKITIFGANAMNWVLEFRTRRWGVICLTLPTLRRFKRKDWYIYASPNATPWACTFYRGHDRGEKIRAQIRRYNFGHGFSTDANYEALHALNEKFDSLRILQYDIDRMKRDEDFMAMSRAIEENRV